MSGLFWAVSLAVLSASPPSLSREGRMLLETASERLNARVGEWVTYEVEGAPQPGFLRLAVVAEQKDAQGRDAVWVELEFGRQAELKAPLAQFLLLVARQTGLRTEGVSRLFIAQGAERLQEVDSSALPSFLAAPGPDAPPSPARPPPDGPGASLRRGPSTRLMTLAGTVTAEPLEVRYQQLVLKRYWISQELPILHLARLEFPPIHYALEVRDHGVDAHPRLRPPPPHDQKIQLEPVSQLPSRFQPLIQSGPGSGP